MKKYYYLIVIISVLELLTVYGCGEKLDLAQFPITNNGTPVINDTVYVLQSPVWNGFNGPEDVILGAEPLVYVADTKNNLVVQMDISGGRIGELNVNRPRKLAQDGNFDLLILSDSVIATGDTVTVLYRVKTAMFGGVITGADKITLINSMYPTPNSSSLRRFTGVTTFPDNSYLLTRRGPEDPFGIDPGNAIIKVRGRDNVTNVTVLSGFQSSGSSFYSIENVSGITSVKNSPTDFIITRSSPDTATLNKVLWFEYNTTNETYDPRFTSSGTGIVSERFGQPDDVTQDNNLSVFVIDSYRNYLYKFNSAGKFMKESFGSFGTGDGKFINPKGVAFYNKVLYIADTGNNRIVRYKLSTDLY